MSDNEKKFNECKAIENIPNLMDGWGCCSCKTYNGNQRLECKSCGHERCDLAAEADVSDLEEVETNFSVN